MPIFDVVLKRLTIRGSIVGTRMDLAEAIHVRRRGNRGKGPCALPRGPPRGRQPSPSRICGQDTSTAGSCFGSPEGRGRRWRPRKASKPTTQGRSRAGRPSPLTPRRRLACSRSRLRPRPVLGHVRCAREPATVHAAAGGHTTQISSASWTDSLPFEASVRAPVCHLAPFNLSDAPRTRRADRICWGA